MAASNRYKYILATGNWQSSFEKAVTDKLNEGWSLYGDPFFAKGLYCQAMTFYDALPTPVFRLQAFDQVEEVGHA
jgi:hypothetical protein